MDSQADPGAAWDAKVAFARLKESTTATTASRGRHLLAINPRVTPVAQRQTRRELALVPQPLRDMFRALVTGQEPWPLYLWGPAGTGKTSAALVLLDHCGTGPHQFACLADVHDWYSGFVEVRHLPRLRIGADQGKFVWSRDGNAGDLAWDQLTGTLKALPLVVFDEIGVGREASDFRLDVLIEVLNLRADNPVRPFVVTSNLKPSEIARVVYDDRVASRILAGIVFHLDGSDRRIERS